MPTHQIEIELPAKSILRTDVRIMVEGDGAKLGELLISKGSIDWKPRKGQLSIRMRWEKFAQLMEQYGADYPRSRGTRRP